MHRQLIDLYEKDNPTFQKLEQAYRQEFKNVDKFSDHIQETKHIKYIADWTAAYKKF